MSTTDLKSRIAELEAEVARLKSHAPATNKEWVEQIAGTFANDPDFDKAMWYGRQWRVSEIDLPRSPQLARLRRQYRAIISELQTLGKFKTKAAAANYADREFTSAYRAPSARKARRSSRKKQKHR